MNDGRGFTLLELLIGLALLSLILALLFGGFRIASASWNTVETRIERSTQEDMAKAFLRRLLSRIQPLRWKQAPDRAVTFRGEPDRMVAVAPLTGQAGSNGIRVVALMAETAESGNNGPLRIVLRETPLRRESADFAEPLAAQIESHTLLDSLSEVRFAYYGAEKKNDPPGWHDVWTNKEELPRLIRVTLVSNTNGPIDLVISTMLSGSRCTWDPFYKRCR